MADSTADRRKIDLRPNLWNTSYIDNIPYDPHENLCSNIFEQIESCGWMVSILKIKVKKRRPTWSSISWSSWKSILINIHIDTNKIRMNDFIWTERIDRDSIFLRKHCSYLNDVLIRWRFFGSKKKCQILFHDHVSNPS